VNTFQRARQFIYRNARSIDLLRWQYHFEGGSEEAVIAALAAYQNEDGGFGYGLEADCWNPASSPIQTWAATEILREIHFDDASHPLIRGILQYLASGLCFDDQHQQWMNTVPDNNKHPHAIWWTYQEGKGQFRYNPTACLAGFFLKYGSKDDPFYECALRIASEAYRFWKSSMPYTEQHITSCFIRLYEYCMGAGIEIAQMDEFRKTLITQVHTELEQAKDKWKTDYVCMPSSFIEGRDSMFFGDHVELIDRECRFIEETQLDDGSFSVPWKWWTEYSEFEIARNWWKADLCIRKMRFLRACHNA